MRLRAVDGFNHTSNYSIPVHAVAAVEEVDVRSGGHVSDVSKRVLLYIPPNGIPKSSQVTITLVDVDEITIPDDQQLELSGSIYDIEPLELELLKTATLTVLHDNDQESRERRLVIFNWSDTDSRWQRVGGSLDKETGKITVALNRLGRFAVMNDLSEEEGVLSISDLDCQPRAFSPKGGGFDTKTTITFNLGKSSDVTVKIYDPSGRLVKKVIDGQSMNQGSSAVVWDGKDYDGNIVVSGLYIVTMEAGSKMETKTVGVMNK